MTLSVNEYNQTYYKGISLSYDLKQLIVSFLLDNGADPTTSAIPRFSAIVFGDLQSNQTYSFQCVEEVLF